MTKKEVNLDDFFTTKKENDGIWVSITAFGKKTGLKALVLGVNSDAVSIEMDRYNKRNTEIEEIDDEVERDRERTNNLVQSVVARIREVKLDDGFEEVKIGGKVITTFDEAFLTNFFKNCLAATKCILDTSGKSVNFTNKKIA